MHYICFCLHVTDKIETISDSHLILDLAFLKKRRAPFLQKRCRACRRRRVGSRPGKELAINKGRTIYVQFLSSAVWKHITWRHDPFDLVLSQHPEHETTRSDLQGRRCGSRAGRSGSLDHNRASWWFEKVLPVIEVSLSRRRTSAHTGGEGGEAPGGGAGRFL